MTSDDGEAPESWTAGLERKARSRKGRQPRGAGLILCFPRVQPQTQLWACHGLRTIPQRHSHQKWQHSTKTAGDWIFLSVTLISSQLVTTTTLHIGCIMPILQISPLSEDHNLVNGRIRIWIQVCLTSKPVLSSHTKAVIQPLWQWRSPVEFPPLNDCHLFKGILCRAQPWGRIIGASRIRTDVCNFSYNSLQL